MGSGFIEPAGRTSSRRAAAVVQTRASLSQASLAAAAASARALAGLQKPEGYWCGDLLADTTLESDYVLLQLWLYPPAGAPGTRPRPSVSAKPGQPFWRASRRAAASTFTPAARPTFPRRSRPTPRSSYPA